MDVKKILVAGDVMLDRYWFGDVNRISPEAPVPIVRIEKRQARLGGAANVARNIVALNGSASLLGVIGDDEAGREIEQILNESGIGNYLEYDAAISTIIKLRVIGRQQQLLRIDFEEPPSQHVLQAKWDRYQALLHEHDIVILSDYAKGGLQQVSAMIERARAANKYVLVDPKGHDFTRYRCANVLTPNKSELKQVIGPWHSEDELTHKAQQLRSNLEIDALLLTRSEEGMSLYQDGEVLHFPAAAREVFDVSGAGDTVIATLARMLAEGKGLSESVTLANRAGGIVVGKLGTATLTLDELFANN